MKLSVVIPCYNEKENIPLLLRRFEEVLSGAQGIEVILVDNGSSDGSAEVLAELLPRYPFAKTVRVEVNQGYGYGILQGLKSADGEYLGWTHADMQTDPADVVKAWELVLAQKDTPVYVKGRRRRRPFMDQLFTVCMGIFESVYFGVPLWDINAQPNVFPRSFFENWENPPFDFAIELYSFCMAKKMQLRMIRTAVGFSERAHGYSSWNRGFKSKINLIKRTLISSYRLKHIDGGKKE